jgi:putative PIG3 family NAD(P)H quinone oxidoreductase
MKAIKIENTGSGSVLIWTDAQKIDPGRNEVKLRVRATAVNRADILQRRGLYPPPTGASGILGLECAGEIVEIGPEVVSWKKGDRVCALLSGGGYSEEVVIHSGMLLPIPDFFSFTEAAAIPEAFYTAFLNLFELGHLKQGEWCIIYTGGSGVGSAAIQLAKTTGANAIATAGTPEKVRKCMELGAYVTLDHNAKTFETDLNRLSKDHKIDLIFDTMGSKYASENINALGYRGRLILIGLLGGTKAQIDFGKILTKNISIVGSTLRNRSLEEKIELTRRIRLKIWPLFESRKIKPVIDSVFSILQVENAHNRMLENRNFGKIILTVP